MNSGKIEVRFCRASELKRGMKVFYPYGKRPRFLTIKSVCILDGTVTIRCGKIEMAFPSNHDIHILK